MQIDPRFIYSPHYDIHYHGLDKFHPFDGRKYSRAYQAVHKAFGVALERRTLAPVLPITDIFLRTVHKAAYLEKLTTSTYIATALEFPILKMIPYSLLHKHLLTPMRLGSMGTLLAAQEALQCGLAINMAGGYHHASVDKGEGFCLFSDIAIAIRLLQETGDLGQDDTALIIDLDAHQGNGYQRVFHDEGGVYMFDMYNAHIYPNDGYARERIDCDVRLKLYTDDDTYLGLLHDRFPAALEEVNNPKIAFYIAGTDIYERDLLGNLKVTEAGVLSRDRFVFETLAAAEIPCVMLLGGGYGRDSFRLIANALSFIMTTWGGAD